MARVIIQIPVNVETSKCIYLTDYKDGMLSYRVSTEPKILETERVEYEGENVIAGPFYFHKSFLQELIEKK